MNISAVTYGKYRVSDDGRTTVLANTQTGRAWTLSQDEADYLNGSDILTKEQLAEEVERDRLIIEHWEREVQTPY